VRDERHGGYGDTSSLPSLTPEQERGAAAVAALTAVLEVQREAAAAADAGLDPTLIDSDEEGTDAAPLPLAEPVKPSRPVDPKPKPAPAPASAGPAGPAEPESAPEAAEPESPPVEEAEPPKPPAPVTTHPAASHTAPIPVIDIPEVDVAELGLADRLGLGETEPDDEVGPTS